MKKIIPINISVPAIKMDIFGETHTLAQRKRIESIIKKFHKINPYDYLLMEGAGDQVLLTKQSKEHALKEEKWSIGPRDIEFGLELDLPIIGIDVWDKKAFSVDKYTEEGYALDLTYSFGIRERRMCSVISEYLRKGRIAMIVGDTHLRTVKTKELGPASPIWERYKNDKDVVIHRSPIKEIE